MSVSKGLPASSLMPLLKLVLLRELLVPFKLSRFMVQTPIASWRAPPSSSCLYPIWAISIYRRMSHNSAGVRDTDLFSPSWTLDLHYFLHLFSRDPSFPYQEGYFGMPQSLRLLLLQERSCLFALGNFWEDADFFLRSTLVKKQSVASFTKQC